jgi:chloride channel protein, CIC family
MRYVNRSYLTKWLVIGILIGLVAGFGATAFYYAIELVSNTILTGLTGFSPPTPNGEVNTILIFASSANPKYYLIPISTIIGGAVAGLLIYRFAPEAEGHGTDAAIDAYHNKNGVVRRRIPVIKTIASAFTIGTGGSAGREGPTAQIAAGFGSIVGGIFKLPAKDRRIAVAAGIGAGIGTIFRSPFGGAVLAGEILYSGPDIEAEALIPAFIATPIGYVIFAYFTSFTPIFGFVTYNFNQPDELLVFALLGALCAGFGRLYTFLFYSTKKFFDRLMISNYFKPMIGAGIAGTIAIFFPQVTGLGYGFVQILINGNPAAITTNYFTTSAVIALLLIAFFKIFATSVTVGSGGSGGVFAPSLVIGGFVGAFVWEIMRYIAPSLFPSAAPLVIIGMIALFGGVGRVPIAVILMVTEMTGSLALVAPAMVAVVVSYFLVGPKYTIYHSQVLSRAESPAHRGEYSIPLMTTLKVEDAMKKDLVTLSSSDSAEEAFRIMSDKKIQGIPVITSDRHVQGILTMSDVMRVPHDELRTTRIDNLMTKNVISVYPDDTLLVALEKLTEHAIGRLPVVDKETNEIVGIVSRSDLFSTYEKNIVR